ncbi:MAG: hypothetical protein IPI21_02305 [Propionivibrio sp.]|nr:hypothetical protein [Propionivibrio sp.]
MPNVGIAIAADPHLLYIHSAQQLEGRYPYAMYEQLRQTTESRHCSATCSGRTVLLDDPDRSVLTSAEWRRHVTHWNVRFPVCSPRRSLAAAARPERRAPLDLRVQHL